MVPTPKPRLGLIAGNGRFPFLVLDAAKAQGFDVVVAAIKEETFPEIESQGAAGVYWISLGELSQVDRDLPEGKCSPRCYGWTGQAKQIFSSIRPDWRLAELLLSLATRNTDALLGAVAKILGDGRISCWKIPPHSSEPLLAQEGILTKRKPSEQEEKDIEYGRAVARQLAQYDIGRTVVVAASACVAVEAMEEYQHHYRTGRTDLEALDSAASTLSRALTVVKIAKPNQDMRFDVPVIGLKTIQVMHEAGAACFGH